MGWFDWLFDNGERSAPTLNNDWLAIVRRRVPHWSYLSGEEKERLDAIALDLIEHKRWEAAKDFEVTDEMVVTVAAQAALLAIGLPDGVYHRIRTIIIHPSTMMLTGEHSYGGGVMSRATRHADGLAEQKGTIAISWDAVLNDARHPDIGHNVVLHEFAHQLDVLDGAMDGRPPLWSDDDNAEWNEVVAAAYDRVAHQQGASVLRSYGGVSPIEFFAVATEAFFSAPRALHREFAELYDVLANFYRQDPAGRIGNDPTSFSVG